MSQTRATSSESKLRTASTLKKNLESKRFLGLSLSGGRAERSALTILEHYPKKGRLFCLRVFDRITAEKEISSDRQLLTVIEQAWNANAVELAIDAPLTLPYCITCQLRCPGNEVCREKPIQWMRKHRKNKKALLSYTERPVDHWLAQLYPEGVEIHQALGANLAPLTARAHYLLRQLEFPFCEVSTRISCYRLGLLLKLPKKHLKRFRNAIGGTEARTALLEAMTSKWDIFFYQQDLKILRDDVHAFESFIAAFVGFSKSHGKTEPCPSHFPLPKEWVHFIL